MIHENWDGFISGEWQSEINVRNFIQTNYKEFTGDGAFLSKATDRTEKLMEKVRANTYMVERSDYLIAYVRHPASSARDVTEYARRREKSGFISVCNLGEEMNGRTFS